jgi:hypothetical protein
MGIRKHRQHLPKITDTASFILHLKEVRGTNFDTTDSFSKRLI